MASERPQITPREARAAVLAGQVVHVVLGSEPEDPTSLHYLDRCYEDDFEPMIYTESVAGWSDGVKEAICEPHDTFYVGWLAVRAPLSITVTDEVPPLRESPGKVSLDS